MKHGLGDPVWWVYAPAMLASSAGAGYGVIAHELPDLLLLGVTAGKRAQDCLLALGPDVILDDAYNNLVLATVGPFIATPQLVVWVRARLLMPLLARLGATEHYKQAYGEVPPMAARHDSTSYAEFVAMSPRYTEGSDLPPPPTRTAPDATTRATWSPETSCIPTHGREIHICVGATARQKATVEAAIDSSTYRVSMEDGGVFSIQRRYVDTPVTPEAFPMTTVSRSQLQNRCGTANGAVAPNSESLRRLSAASEANSSTTCHGCGAIPIAPYNLAICLMCAAATHVSCAAYTSGEPAQRPTPLPNREWVCHNCAERHDLPSGVVEEGSNSADGATQLLRPLPVIFTRKVPQPVRDDACTPPPSKPQLYPDIEDDTYPLADQRTLDHARSIPVRPRIDTPSYAPAKWRTFLRRWDKKYVSLAAGRCRAPSGPDFGQLASDIDDYARSIMEVTFPARSGG